MTETMPHVSVVLCTYNRCDLLPTALSSLVAQDAHDTRYEIIVVDNNSSDSTRAVIERFIRTGDTDIRYLFESKQGLSHARNAGIAGARAPIVAFTDDDVTASPNWIATIHAAFDDPDVACVGGKVLPQWPSPPPPWLTKLHWSPLAVVDRGDAALRANTSMPLVFVGANLAIRKDVFGVAGTFDADLQRVKDGIGSTEDHEFLLRVYGAGYSGLYVPTLVMWAPVQEERLTKRYHRRWHAGHGRFMARMNLIKPDPVAPNLFGLPSYYYGGLVKEATSWLWETARGHRGNAFWHELQLRAGVEFVRASRCLNGRDKNAAAEALRFAGLLLRKKWSRSRLQS